MVLITWPTSFNQLCIEVFRPPLLQLQFNFSESRKCVLLELSLSSRLTSLRMGWEFLPKCPTAASKTVCWKFPLAPPYVLSTLLYPALCFRSWPPKTVFLQTQELGGASQRLEGGGVFIPSSPSSLDGSFPAALGQPSPAASPWLCRPMGSNSLLFWWLGCFAVPCWFP